MDASQHVEIGVGDERTSLPWRGFSLIEHDLSVQRVLCDPMILTSGQSLYIRKST